MTQLHAIRPSKMHKLRTHVLQKLVANDKFQRHSIIIQRVKRQAASNLDEFKTHVSRVSYTSYK